MLGTCIECVLGRLFGRWGEGVGDASLDSADTSERDIEVERLLQKGCGVATTQMVDARQQRHERHQTWTEYTSRNPLRELRTSHFTAAWALHLVQQVLVDVRMDLRDLCNLVSRRIPARLLRQVMVAPPTLLGEMLVTTRHSLWGY